jgi:hypothetical protein
MVLDNDLAGGFQGNFGGFTGRVIWPLVLWMRLSVVHAGHPPTEF